MKRIISMLLVAIVFCCFCGCSSNDKESSYSSSKNANTSSAKDEIVTSKDIEKFILSESKSLMNMDDECVEYKKENTDGETTISFKYFLSNARVTITEKNGKVESVVAWAFPASFATGSQVDSNASVMALCSAAIPASYFHPSKDAQTLSQELLSATPTNDDGVSSYIVKKNGIKFTLVMSSTSMIVSAEYVD